MAKPLAPRVSRHRLPLEAWSDLLRASLKSMSPHVALEGHGIDEVLATGGAGKEASFMGTVVVDQASGVTVALPTLLTAVGLRDAISLLTVLAGGWMEQFTVL